MTTDPRPAPDSPTNPNSPDLDLDGPDPDSDLGLGLQLDGPDPGLFGPGSVSWRVMSDPVFALGGLRALFLQALYPRAMAGVAQNSDLNAPPWDRFLRTARYVHTVTFGTAADAERAATRVRAVHRALTATDPATGERFRLDDPDALLWVHVVEAESFLNTARRAGLRLTPADADRYYREQIRAAALVGIDPQTVPATAADVEAYYRGIRPALRLTPEAAHAARFLLWPPMSRSARLRGARAGWLALTATAFGLPPAWARRLFGLPGLAAADLPPAATARALRAAALLLPTPLRHGSPILQAARRRLADTDVGTGTITDTDTDDGTGTNSGAHANASSRIDANVGIGTNSAAGTDVNTPRGVASPAYRPSAAPRRA